MKKKTISSLIALSMASALPLQADLVKFKDWDKSPEAVYLLSDPERKEWKNVKTDEAAEKFIALFWAKRDPEPKTPQNEYKQRFDALVAKADELFKMGDKKRGALTERGKLLILIGPPKSMAQSQASSVDQPTGSTSGGFINTGGGGTTLTVQFLYEQPQLPAWADVKSLDAKFQVDVGTNSEHLIDMGPVKRLESKAVEMALVNPTLKEVPVYKTKEQIDAERKAANEAAVEAAKGAAISAPVRELLDKALAGEASGPLTLMPMIYRDGATRLALQLFATADKVTAPEGAKLAVLARTKDGKDASRREEAAALQKSRGDFFADRMLPLNPGSYDVAAVLLDAAGNAIVTGKRSVEIKPLPTAFDASELILAYNDLPAEGAKPEDPFTFSGRKFVSKADPKLDGKADGLSYALRIYNPSVDPATKKMNLKRAVAIKPVSGSWADLPQAPEDPAPAPEPDKDGRVTIVLDLAGNVVDSGLSQYFRPGDYMFRVKITDLASTAEPKPFIERLTPFTVVGPAPAPAAPPAAPKKK